jgi:hypothetical protein
MCTLGTIMCYMTEVIWDYFSVSWNALQSSAVLSLLFLPDSQQILYTQCLISSTSLSGLTLVCKWITEGIFIQKSSFCTCSHIYITQRRWLTSRSICTLYKDDQRTKRLLSVPTRFHCPNFLKQKKRKLRISNGCQTVPSFPNRFQKIMFLFNKCWMGNYVQYW